MRKRLAVVSLFAAVLCAGCGNSDKDVAKPKDESKEATIAALKQSDSNAVAAQVASTLQACSYDGNPVQFGVGKDAPKDCRDMVAQVMQFTGLPQNFVVTEADVPNAAAAILVDDNKLPHRVIGFNPEFMDVVNKATGGNTWAAVSIMAHEAAHHLAGHTIQPGGSRPPIELEADKFSGFVLYKMGASRADALKAIQTLVPEEVHSGSSHPPRGKRVAAITEGWDQACQQTGRGDCATGAPGSTPPAGLVAQGNASPAPQTQAAASPAKVVIPVAEPSSETKPDVAMPSTTATPAPVATTAGASKTAEKVVMPKPDANALPTKGIRFVYDETGMVNPAVIAAQEKKFFDHAKDKGVEIVTIFAKDLHGMSPDDYAWAMMRQLRVGKLDVGNGVVLVFVPETKQFGMAFGPGTRNEMAIQMERYPQSAKSLMDDYIWNWCKKNNGCDAANSENLFLLSDNVRRDTAKWEWTVRYQSLRDIFDTSNAESKKREESGATYDPKNSSTWRKIVKLTGTVVELNPDPNRKFPQVNEVTLKSNGKAVYVKTDDGLHAVLYFHPETEKLMPAGAIKSGKRYSFIARENGLSWNPEDAMNLELFSYDLL